MKIVRANLRDQAVEMLRERMLSGDLAPGQVMYEEALAAELGISRTPLREALLELTRERLTSKRTGRGFVVCPLEAEEVRELYPLRALLESEALRQSGIPDPDRVAELESLNEKLQAEPPGVGWIQLDDAWHELLIDACHNRHLRPLIRHLRTLTRRYELAFLAAIGSPVASTSQHGDILRQLREKDLDAACRTLADNMTIGVEPLLAWLEGETEAAQSGSA
ncbi:MAG: GntR family transcriptional regulator [Acidobacteriota bacterium]